jgi:hypothetical protein
MGECYAAHNSCSLLASLTYSRCSGLHSGFSFDDNYSQRRITKSSGKHNNLITSAHGAITFSPLDTRGDGR